MHHHGVGDPLDAVILGDQLPYGYSGKVKVKGVMRFMDAGFVDDKLICTQLIQGNFLPLFYHNVHNVFGCLVPNVVTKSANIIH
jgi:hypothetical protein